MDIPDHRVRGVVGRCTVGRTEERHPRNCGVAAFAPSGRNAAIDKSGDATMFEFPAFIVDRHLGPGPMSLAVSCFALAGMLLGACADPASNSPPRSADGEVVLVEVASGLTSPVHITSAPGDPRLFVVEQPGTIRIIDNGQLLPEPFLDITSKVRSGGERGLLSVAFHPDYARNGFFFVNYTDLEGDTRVERYSVQPDNPNRADAESGTLVIMVDQPQANHNGGQLAFGPDGMLYIGMGDGGGAGDRNGNGQNPNTLLGALLRIDVDGGTPYAIPPDNPFANGGGRPEIWAIGLRNPWRFSFDVETNRIYIADIGQNRVEEIHVAPADAPGLNYGWNTLEGTLCFEPNTGCNRTGLLEPVVEYGRQDGVSITGGYVYRGQSIPELQGHYLYADYRSGWIRSFRLADDGSVTDERQLVPPGTGNFTSFGVDAVGEMYVVTHSGTVYRLAPGE